MMPSSCTINPYSHVYLIHLFVLKWSGSDFKLCTRLSESVQTNAILTKEVLKIGLFFGIMQAALTWSVCKFGTVNINCCIHCSDYLMSWKIQFATEDGWMTKLMEWLLFAVLFFSIWIAVISGNVNLHFIKEWKQFVLFLPPVALFVCGLYAAIVVLYRTFTFNNCEQAAMELQEQIEEARKDLQTKGIVLKCK
ncbi:Dolichol-phosphate mannosyltransferase subunit 3 [Melipona quadrifasciata]|uniref:Dolichol-phosphate mannose synthase subunit 3 n=1 Tax=Melipona quadrifasciata TaxID=166423 RepID=A0A0M9A906_9HYME|nr:Dolichol-phosphate mannosyltransferase subunit 3 [Melipona quadrifasciata]